MTRFLSLGFIGILLSGCDPGAPPEEIRCHDYRVITGYVYNAALADKGWWPVKIYVCVQGEEKVTRDEMKKLTGFKGIEQ